MPTIHLCSECGEPWSEDSTQHQPSCDATNRVAVQVHDDGRSTFVAGHRVDGDDDVVQERQRSRMRTVRARAPRRAWALAMLAKEIVFLAQDAADQIDLPARATGRSPSAGFRKHMAMRERARRELGRARAALESLDNAMRSWCDDDAPGVDAWQAASSEARGRLNQW